MRPAEEKQGGTEQASGRRRHLSWPPTTPHTLSLRAISSGPRPRNTGRRARSAICSQAAPSADETGSGPRLNAGRPNLRTMRGLPGPRAAVRGPEGLAATRNMAPAGCSEPVHENRRGLRACPASRPVPPAPRQSPLGPRAGAPGQSRVGTWAAGARGLRPAEAKAAELPVHSALEDR